MLANLDRPIVDQKRYDAATERGVLLASRQDSETDPIGRVFAQDAEHGGAFGNLARYEAAVEHAFYRALGEFKRAQDVRARES